jgi:hypothetical protein
MSDQPTDPQDSDETAAATDGETIAADERDARSSHDPDRPPTSDEEEMAERVASDVDLDSVSEHEEEMTRLGADVEGEGRIV